MDLTNSQSNNGWIDLMRPREEHISSRSREEMVPNYDFHPIRPITVSQQPANVVEARVLNSADADNIYSGFTVQNRSSLNSSIQHAEVSLEKEQNTVNAALLSEINTTIKRHTGNLLHALEGLSARISQMESRTRHLENLMDDLKLSLEDNQGSTDGKLRHLENILTEVQANVQVITDKQVEAELHQEEKTQRSILEQQPEDVPLQHHFPPSVLLPYQTPPNEFPTIRLGESQTRPRNPQNQEYQLPPPRQLQPPVPPPLPQPPPGYLPPPPQPLYSQPPAQPFQQHLDGGPHLPSSQHFYGSQLHEPYPHGALPCHYENGGYMKQQQLNPAPAPAPVGESGYHQLPRARALPQASGSEGGGLSSIKVPMDDVVDKITNMGFSRKQVRDTVGKLTENGQSVDLNVVLDKLMMNDGHKFRRRF